jgi:hypothetical protein
MSKFIVAINNDRENCKEEIRKAIWECFHDDVFEEDFHELAELLMQIVEEYY